MDSISLFDLIGTSIGMVDASIISSKSSHCNLQTSFTLARMVN